MMSTKEFIYEEACGPWLVHSQLKFNELLLQNIPGKVTPGCSQSIIVRCGLLLPGAHPSLTPP